MGAVEERDRHGVDGTHQKNTARSSALAERFPVMRLDLRRVVALCSVFMFLGSATYGNDSAASTALGGIQLRKEARVAMRKERLTIGIGKVTVEYEFLNGSDSDITTEVAFPIPPYGVTFSAGGIRVFDDFRVWVEGKEFRYQTESRAKLGSRDYSELLQRLGVDIASLGHFDDSGQEPYSKDFRRLTKDNQEQLVKAGLFDAEDKFPQWTVEKLYHWSQVFPAHKVVHVRHQYEPGIGFMLVQATFLDKKERDRQISGEKDSVALQSWIQDARQIETACVEPKLAKALAAATARLQTKQNNNDQGYLQMQWVDYILTTANSWKTPINDFELLVERPSPGWFVSFCWNGPVERVDATHFRAKATDFVPSKELHVAFLGVY